MQFNKIMMVLLCGQVLLASSDMVAAQQTVPEPDSIQDIEYQGSPIFRLHFYDAHDDVPAITTNDDSDTYKSSYTLNNALKQSTASGVSYVAQLVGPQSALRAPVNIYVFTYDWESADGGSGSIDAECDPDFLNYALIDGKVLNFMTGGYIHIGIMNASDHEAKGWGLKFDSQLPNNGNQFNLPATLAHEMLHALGVTSTSDQATNGMWQFYNKLDAFEQHLYDATGKQARPGMMIMDKAYYDAAQNAPEDVFFVNGFDTWSEESGVYFSGVNVQQVLNGA